MIIDIPIFIYIGYVLRNENLKKEKKLFDQLKQQINLNPIEFQAQYQNKYLSWIGAHHFFKGKLGELELEVDAYPFAWNENNAVVISIKLKNPNKKKLKITKKLKISEALKIPSYDIAFNPSAEAIFNEEIKIKGNCETFMNTILTQSMKQKLLSFFLNASTSMMFRLEGERFTYITGGNYRIKSEKEFERFKLALEILAELSEKWMTFEGNYG